MAHSVNRRQFLGRSASSAAGLAAGLVGLAGAGEAAEPLRVGVIGVRRQGRKLAAAFASQHDALVAAICDVDQSVLDRSTKELQDAGAAPRRERDFQRLLDDPHLDAVIIATPDHSHAAIAIAALDAGKHVYLETPVCHAFAEIEPLRTAAARSRRVIQCGHLDRSLPHVESAIHFVRSGQLGSVPFAKAWAVHRKNLAATTPSGLPNAPAGIDYDAWLFPGPERPFDPDRFHRGWTSFWDHGAGELGAWGAPLLDLAIWGLDLESPERVFAAGGRPSPFHAEVPGTLSVTCVYPSAILQWEHRDWSNHPPEGRSAGVAFHGQRGTLVLDRGGWKVYGGDLVAGEEGRADLIPHVRDFLDAIRLRRTPAAPLEIGLAAASLCHAGVIACRLRREVRFDRSGLVADDEVRSLAQAHYRPGIQFT